MINNAPTLKLEDTLLRKPKQSDIEDRIIIGRQKEFIKMCGGDTRTLLPFSIEEANKWYQKLINTPCEWIIEQNSKMIGIARLTVNTTDNKARYAIGIFDETIYGKGIGTRVTKIVLDYAFNVLHLHRVDLRVLEYNERAIHCYEKCGFIKEGVEREGAYIEDRYYSDIMMSILENEYFSNYSK